LFHRCHEAPVSALGEGWGRRGQELPLSGESGTMKSFKSIAVLEELLNNPHMLQGLPEFTSKKSPKPSFF